MARVDFVNQHWEESTGLSTEMTLAVRLGKPPVHPEDLKQHAEKWRASFVTGEPFENEARFRQAADGQYRWFLVRAVPLRDRRGKILKWYGNATDIEDRKQTEEKFRGLLERQPDAVAVVNRRGEIVLVNAQLEEMFRLSASERSWARRSKCWCPRRFRGRHPGHRSSCLWATLDRGHGLGVWNCMAYIKMDASFRLRSASVRWRPRRAMLISVHHPRYHGPQACRGGPAPQRGLSGRRAASEPHRQLRVECSDWGNPLV